MNSYPPELLAQLAPVMFVAGLDAPTPSAQPTSNSQGTPPSTPSTSKAQDFNLLTLRLRESLQAQRKVAVWQPEKLKIFQVILVDKDVRFPPRKLAPSDEPQFQFSHSPLSPLTPSSPLYPDGLIAPIWIRKHTTLVPSVFVMFMRIFEFPPHNPRSPLDAPDVDRERERDQEERKRDTELASEVALRKKSTNDRGIKLTVVLMASRRMLDDPTLDARLTYIRRQSGLDSRAALFVLSPVSPAELSEFVKSLQQALYEPALEYYTAHSKRVRRKRNRHSQVTSHPVTASSGTPNIVRPLRPEGWTVRYEYKMACFAEFRGEDEVALKHYQDAHAMLVVMFGSTAILPPRTKRWAEAKVLADCINVKISKLYLYNNEHALALSHHNTHMRMFGDFSRGWGIGEETFEYWSWMARQHRILAELLEQGARSALTLPIHKPAQGVINQSTVTSQTIPSTGRGTTATNALEVDSLRSLGINPSHALQHPGFYYYMAAKCTEMRRTRFLAALEAEQSQQSTILSPGFANEKKVDHLTIILELYTKAYELFKKFTKLDLQNPTQGRLTLWIAYRIAQTYYDSGKFEMAIRFFERIAKTYRREKWGPLLRPLLSTWYSCAQQLGDVDLSVRLLVEMLGHDALPLEDPNSIEEDLMAVLKSTVPSSDDPIVIDLAESTPIFDSNVVFWAPEIKVGEVVAFQLSLTSPTRLSISKLPFSTLTIHFSHSNIPIVVRHADSGPSSRSLIQHTNLGHIGALETPQELISDLQWGLGECKVFSGTMMSDLPTILKVSKVVLTIEESQWQVVIPFSPCGSRKGVPLLAKWLACTNPPRFIPMNREETLSSNVQYRTHDLAVTLTHDSPAYLGEKYPIIIGITNSDNRTLDVVVDVLLQPTELDDADNIIMLDEKQSSGFIKGVSFGSLAPGVKVLKTLYLLNAGAVGDRMVDLSIQSKSAHEFGTAQDPGTPDMTETLRTLIVPTVNPIKITHNVMYTRPSSERLGLADLRTYDADFWDNGSVNEALVETTIECAGPSGLFIESITLEQQRSNNASVLNCSADSDHDLYPYECLQGDEIRHICRISITDNTDSDGPIPSPGVYQVKWRRYHLEYEENPPISITSFPLPPLHPPIDALVALLTVPPTATLHTPIPLTLAIRNHPTSRSANVTIQLELDPSDGFVVAGLRSGRVPILMPGAEERLTWNLIPIECGHLRIPHIKVTNRRKPLANEVENTSDTETVKIVDVRMAQRHDIGLSQREENQDELGTILVLPY
ncbi:Gryzun, putative trafficking through golgi-domain-containing protein [Collybia nuda]|uniref:Gryzun, putative trafficking through golgi-domain-containing protein n=1 Tax=Collybia nuda TaxID=64659 RepID=A0A9P5Y3Q4_9AGAR|nr:Gryzun, putative trafficking through golgi-domain-containing protein [Collybia nuda]